MITRRFDSYGNQTYFRRSESVDRSSKNVADVSIENVANVFDEDFKVKVNAFIDGEVFCDAVRRCLLNDLIAGLLDEEDEDKHKKYS
ncbi:hypothetical protein EJF36_12240 [Bacillus sp. HMF5848]|uniref:hypothetical protein n=1 Tax=Bacillus sp. HMF5848 TaxID=2495421 RepID=UPI000F78D901|nr:hypothetical protein [Bacillus sp. HMF5848]RSK27584.1 hypothetical protein EJF36_12240 [Bacillus sp. HMF5848]